jgi:hypothetical protein
MEQKRYVAFVDATTDLALHRGNNPANRYRIVAMIVTRNATAGSQVVAMGSA